MSKQQDTIDHAVAFLKKREGIDKTLKLVRYTAKLVAATTPKGTDLNTRCAALEKSVGVSRKAFRLGKFLQDVNELRKSKATGSTALLELVAYGGEGIYLFIEQLAWLMKAGALSKSAEEQLAFLSSWAELLGYIADTILTVQKIRDLAQQEAALVAKIQKRQAEDGVPASNFTPATTTAAAAAAIAADEAKLRAVRFAKALKMGAVVQNACDAMIAINDLRGGKDRFISHPVNLALAGLLSGSISFYKNWSS